MHDVGHLFVVVAAAGQLTDLERFVEHVPRRAQAVLCNYRLKTDGTSSYNGEIRLYVRDIPEEIAP